MKAKKKKIPSITKKELFKQEELRFRKGAELRKKSLTPLIEFYRNLNAGNKAALSEYHEFIKTNSSASTSRQHLSDPSVFFPMRKEGQPPPRIEPVNRIQVASEIVRILNPLKNREGYDYAQKTSVPSGIDPTGSYPSRPPYSGVPLSSLPRPLPDKSEGIMGFDCNLEGNRVIRFVESLGFDYSANSSGFTEVMTEVQLFTNSLWISCPNGSGWFFTRLRVRIQNKESIANKLGFLDGVHPDSLSSVQILYADPVGILDTHIHDSFPPNFNLVGAFDRIAGKDYTIWFDLILEAALNGPDSMLNAGVDLRIPPWEVTVSEHP